MWPPPAKSARVLHYHAEGLVPLMADATCGAFAKGGGGVCASSSFGRLGLFKLGARRWPVRHRRGRRRIIRQRAPKAHGHHQAHDEQHERQGNIRLQPVPAGKTMLAPANGNGSGRSGIHLPTMESVDKNFHKKLHRPTCLRVSNWEIPRCRNRRRCCQTVAACAQPPRAVDCLEITIPWSEAGNCGVRRSRK